MLPLSKYTFSKISALALFMCLSSTSLADEFTVTYADTILGYESTTEYNDGEQFTISVVLDNGGSSIISQIWAATDVVSITYTMNDAPNTITTVIDPNVSIFFSGNFATDASGVLTEVLGWQDFSSTSTVISTNDPFTLAVFHNDALNAVYSSGDDTTDTFASMTNVVNGLDSDFWVGPTAVTVVTESHPVPTLSIWAMIALVLFMMTATVANVRKRNS